MNEKTKSGILITVIGVSLFAALMNFSTVVGFAGEMVSLILPVIAGGILALFINVPMNALKKYFIKISKKKKKPFSEKQILIFSFLITIVGVLFILILVMTLLVPEIIRSSRSLYTQIEERIVYMDTINFNIQWLEEVVSKIDLNKITQHFSKGADALISNIVEAFSSTVNVVVTAGFAIIISIYMTLSKERLCRHARILVCAYLKPNWADNILHFCKLFSKSFSNFLSGQCTEAVILGILMFFAFTISGLPYGSLVGVLTAVCAIIPYVGAFISCAVSVFLTFIIDPAMAIRCLIVYFVIQFIENQFIYPRVVGGSVGLPPLYTLVAALIGGKLFGIIGIIFFIPLAAVVIELIKEDAAKRLQCRENAAAEKEN